MSKGRVAKRSKIKPFIKTINYNHLMPTRYTLELEGLKGVVSNETFKEVSKREEAKKTVKKTLEERYTSGKNRWFFTPLSMCFGLDLRGAFDAASGVDFGAEITLLTYIFRILMLCDFLDFFGEMSSSPKPITLLGCFIQKRFATSMHSLLLQLELCLLCVIVPLCEANLLPNTPPESKRRYAHECISGT